jgi:hypothetical protein
MGKTRQFLDTLSDHELAFFYKYKLHTYMRDTQLNINAYVIERDLNHEKINQLITKPTQLYYKKAKCCPRCGTNKLLVNTVEWTETYGKAGYEDEIAVGDAMMGKATYKDEIICNVCNFWLQDPNNKNPEKSKENKWSIWSFINFILDI